MWELAGFLRRVRRNPLFVLAAVAPLGLGLACCAALLGIASPIFRAPLHVEEPDRIVYFDSTAPELRADPDSASRASANARATAFITTRASVEFGTGFEMGSEALVGWKVRLAFVSPEVFALTGVKPLVGRLLTIEDRSSRPQALVIGERLWRTRFGAAQDIVNRVVNIPGTVGGHRWLVVGVTPDGFDFPTGMNAWTPLVPNEFPRRLAPQFARLAPHATLESVRNAVAPIRVVPFREYVQPKGRLGLVVIIVASAILLMIGWIQGAAFFVSSIVSRAREDAVRRALGATWWHLVTRIALEVALVACAAFLVALAVGSPLLRGLVASLPVNAAAGRDFTISGPVWSVLGVAVLCGSIATAIVAVGLSSARGAVALLSGSLSAYGSPRVRFMKSVVVAAQVAVVTLLWFATGMVLSSYRTAVRVPLGFDPSGLVGISIPPPIARPHATPEEVQGLEQRYASMALASLRAIRELPSVSTAAFAGTWPFGPTPATVPLRAGDRPEVECRISWGSRGLVGTLGAKIIAGAEPTEAEIVVATTDRAIKPVLINQKLAEYLGGPIQALGAVLRPVPSVGYQVVGIVEDIAQERIDAEAQPAVFGYLPDSTYDFVLLARLRDRAASLEPIRVALNDIWRGEAGPRPVFSLDDLAEDATAEYRARLHVIGSVASLSTPIVLIGLWLGLLQIVREQRGANAVRAALGAPRAAIFEAACRSIVPSVSFGAACGIIGSTLLAKYMERYALGAHALSASALLLPGLCLIVVIVMTSVVAMHSASRPQLSALFREP
jgi:hypothetical protein